MEMTKVDFMTCYSNYGLQILTSLLVSQLWILGKMYPGYQIVAPIGKLVSTGHTDPLAFHVRQ